MRKYFLILLLLISAAGFSQAPNIIYGKDVIIQTRDTSSAELTIKNSTRNVLGYFKNIGGGKGQYVLIPQSDITALPDSLLARYTKSQADARFKSISYIPSWLELTDVPSNFSTTYALSNDIQDSLLNKVSRNGSYANPSWITSLDYSKLTGTVPTWNQNTTGNAATVTNGVYTTGSYANPSWITSLDYSKLTGTVPTWNQNTTGNAATVTNGVYTTGSYANPSWITSLDYSKLTGTVPTWNQNTTGNAATVTNGVYTTGSYANPSWITELAWSKISGAPSFITGITGTMVTTALGYTPENLANKGVANGYADLDASGKIPASRIDFGQTGQTFVVASQAAMLAVSGANVGALAIRTDQNKNYRLIAQPASTLANWQVLLSPDAPVQSVNGFTGNVNLLTTHISEGSNYWWTAARSRAAQSLTTSGSSGAATYDNTTGVLNIPTYTLAGLGGQPALSGTGFVKISGTTISYDNSTYLTTETDPTIYSWAKAASKPTYSWGEITGTVPTWNQNTTGNAATVTNGVYTTGSYANPSWITSLDYSKLTGTVPTWNQNTTGNAATATTATNWSGSSYLGSYAYRSSGLAELSGATFTGNINGSTSSFLTSVNVGSGIENASIGAGSFGFYNASASNKFIKLSDDASTINAIGFSKSGSTSNVWFPSGKVGVGNSSPEYKLSVSPSSSYSAINTGDGFQIDGISGIGTGTNMIFGLNPSIGSVIQARASAASGPININPYGGQVLINGAVANGLDAFQVNGSISSGSISANTGNRTLTFDNITNYGQPLTINSAGSLPLYLQTNGTTSLTISSSQEATFSKGLTVGTDGIFGNSRTSNNDGATVVSILGSSQTSTSAQLNLTQVWNGTQYPVVLKNTYNSNGGAASSLFSLSTTQFNGSIALTSERLRIDGNDGSANFSNSVTSGTFMASNSSFLTYTNDGLFNANARPSKVTTPGGKEILFGYWDNGAAGYFPRIGFTASTNWSIGVISDNNTFTVMTTNAGSLSNGLSISSSGVGTFSGSVNSTGFIKSGSSDSYFLLGGGGHVAASTYATVSSLSSYVNTTGNQLEIGGNKSFLGAVEVLSLKTTGGPGTPGVLKFGGKTNDTVFTGGSSYVLPVNIDGTTYYIRLWAGVN